MLSENIFPMIGRRPRLQRNRNWKWKLTGRDDAKTRIANQLDDAGKRPVIGVGMIQKHDRREYFGKRVYFQQESAVGFENPSNFTQDLHGVHDMVEDINT